MEGWWRADPHARRACRALAAISYTVTPRVGALVWWGIRPCQGGATCVKVRLDEHVHGLACPCASRNPLPRPCNLMCLHDDRRGVKRVRKHDSGVVERELSASCMYVCVPHSYAIARHSATTHRPRPHNTTQHLTTPTSTKQLHRARLYVLELLADQRLHLCASKSRHV